MAEINLVTLTCLYLAAISSTHLILLLSSVPPEIKDGHHPTSPSDLATLHRDLWAVEQLCHKELPNLTLRHWDSWQGGKHGGCPCTFPRLTPLSAAPLTALTCSPFHAAGIGSYQLPQGQDGDKGQGCSGCPVSPIWPVQLKAAMAAPETQTQLHRLHHSHCPKAQASTVEFLLSIPIGKCQIMFQYKSVMCDSTAWACSEISAFLPICSRVSQQTLHQAQAETATRGIGATSAQGLFPLLGEQRRFSDATSSLFPLWAASRGQSIIWGWIYTIWRCQMGGKNFDIKRSI